MKIWSKQEYYDRLVQAATDGTFPSFREDPSCDGRIRCCYRQGGHRCAIGLLLPDEEYKPDMDSSYWTVYKFEPGMLDLVEGLTLHDLSRIQYVHDQHCLLEVAWDPVSFVKGLNNLACFQDVVQVDPYRLPVGTGG